MRPELPVVVEQTGEGQYLATVEGLPGLRFVIGPDGIPRVEAADVGAWVALVQPRNARSRVDTLLRARILNDSDVCTVRVQTSRVGGRPATLKFLTRKGALKFAAHSGTPEGADVLDAIVTVFLAVGDGKLVPAGHVPSGLAEIRAELAALRADVAGLHLQAREAVETWPGIGEVIGHYEADAYIKGAIKRIATKNGPLDPTYDYPGRVQRLHRKMRRDLRRPDDFAWAELPRAELGRAKSWLAREERHVDARLKRLPPITPPFQPQLPERGD